MTYRSEIHGSFFLSDNCSSFFQVDSLLARDVYYTSRTFYCDTTCAVIDYGRTEPKRMSVTDRRAILYGVSLLTPIPLLRDFLGTGRDGFVRYARGAADTIVYRSEDERLIALAIDPARHEVLSATRLYHDNMYGDVTYVIDYDGYAACDSGHRSYPTRIVARTLGFDASVATVNACDSSFDTRRVSAFIPASYRLNPDDEPPTTAIRVSRYEDGIHLLDVEAADARCLVVEFKDFLLVAEAPLSAAIGEMIIARAREIAPNKPIRYFVFGHHHPHYIGGMRAFVHRGATVLTTRHDSSYVEQLAAFRHTLKPDSLELNRRPVRMELFDSMTIVTDGELEMQIIHIGDLSRHTEDYLVYYFPRYKLLFEGDLVWISDTAALAPAGRTQSGLYEAIRLHKLDVETIMQSWPLKSGGVKAVIDFQELERSVQRGKEEQR